MIDSTKEEDKFDRDMHEFSSGGGKTKTKDVEESARHTVEEKLRGPREETR